ncbi:hypothetical protein [Paenibacillus thalictri]|uniref:Uncharacterized protein n=1 Tax=Paenibacillus thalictri TaxID=2527873 RepID=A0A4Q9DXW6_9BACL|nr:hypothetical protein [Paenibacillus thalictri]TBL81246.1 hypothetical protein EYB31_03930 [Paenibacillus thalictri]
MLMWIGIAAVIVRAGLKDIPALWGQRSYKELIMLTMLIVVIASVCGVQMAHVKLPNPLKGIETILKPYVQTIESLLT